MIAADFWGVKARKTAELFGLLRLVVARAKRPNLGLFVPFVRKETVRISGHVLNSTRITQRARQGKG